MLKVFSKYMSLFNEDGFYREVTYVILREELVASWLYR